MEKNETKDKVDKGTPLNQLFFPKDMKDHHQIMVWVHLRAHWNTGLEVFSYDSR